MRVDRHTTGPRVFRPVQPATPPRPAASHPLRFAAPDAVCHALFVALALALTWPLARDLMGKGLAIGPDGHLFMWTLAWDVHAALTQPLRLFDANIYAPLPNTLAYSENLFGSAILAAPVLWLTRNPLLALNLVELASVALCGSGAYVLARRFGYSRPAAFVAGLVFAYSPARFFRTGQLHLGPVQWIPFGLAFLHSYLKDGRRRDLLASLGFLTLQILTSGHGAVFALVAYAALGVHHLVLGGAAHVTRRLADVGLPGVLLLVPAVLVYLPYRRAQAEMGLRRALENWTVTPESFFVSPAYVHQWVLKQANLSHLLETASAFLFPGLLPLTLAAVAVVWGAGRRDTPEGQRDSRQSASARDVLRGLLTVIALGSALVAAVVAVWGPWHLRAGEFVLRARSSWRAALIGLSATGLWACLAWREQRPGPPARRLAVWWGAWRDRRRRDGRLFAAMVIVAGVWPALAPPIGIWPLIHDWPALSLVRVPSRFITLAVLGLALLSAAGADRLFAFASRRLRPVAVAVLGALILAECVAPLSVVAIDVAPPAVDRWIAELDGPVTVAEVPLPDARFAGAHERRQTTYMLHSTAHWRPTVHGYSGIRPPFHERLYAAMRTFPDDASLDALHQAGVTHVVVHGEYYAPDEWNTIRDTLARQHTRLTLRFVSGTGRVYALSPP